MTVDWRGWTPGQWALRLVVVAASVAALWTRALAGEAPRAWQLLLVAALAAGWALAPESAAGVVVLLVVGWAWAASSAGEVSAWALLAAGAMVTGHLAALVLGYGPPRLPVAPGVVRLWAVRGVVVMVPALLVWLVARSVEQLPASTTVWVVGLGVAVSVVVVAVAAVQALMPSGDDR